MSNEFSNFRSSIIWPEYERKEEEATGEFKPIGEVQVDVIAAAAEAYKIAGITESPIETLFGARFSLHAQRLCSNDGWSFGIGDSSADLVLRPQFPLGRFRYDFAVIARGIPVVLIECDGKDFHSSDEQMANDDAKNKAAHEVGLILLRFTGSELNRDPDSCVLQTFQAMAKALK